MKKIAPQKSLFFNGREKGIPIVILTSQFFANVYLNALDQLVKHRLKCRYYLRYCDDFILPSDSREKFLKWKDAIQTFLEETLKLTLNEKRQCLAPVSNGINFLGYIVRKDYFLVRRRVANNLRKKLSCYETRLIKEDPPRYIRLIYNYEQLENLRASLASYFGHFKWANAFA